VAEEIWVCEKQTCTKWEGDITDYKAFLKKRVLSENDRFLKGSKK
jgi:ATP-binding cassette subfamily F protein 2